MAGTKGQAKPRLEMFNKSIDVVLKSGTTPSPNPMFLASYSEE